MVRVDWASKSSDLSLIKVSKLLSIFIKAKKIIRFKRFKLKGGNKTFFETLNKKQLKDSKKIKLSDHVIVNESNKNVLKKRLLAILRQYE